MTQSKILKYHLICSLINLVFSVVFVFGYSELETTEMWWHVMTLNVGYQLMFFFFKLSGPTKYVQVNSNSTINEKMAGYMNNTMAPRMKIVIAIICGLVFIGKSIIEMSYESILMVMITIPILLGTFSYILTVRSNKSAVQQNL